MRRLSVRVQLALWFAACLAAGLAAFGLGVYLLFGEYLLGEVDRALEEEILEVVREVRRSATGDLRGELGKDFAGHPFYVIEVTGPAGESVFRTPDSRSATLAVAPPPADGYFRGTIDAAAGPPYRVIAQRVARPDGAYVVAVGDSLASYRQILSRLTAALALTGPAAAGAALFGGYWLSRRALAPVDRLTRAALSVTAAGLDRRVPEDGADDEVGRLAAAFNQMIGRLEAAFDELRRFAADAAHELRTPLAVLKTGAEVALRSGRSGADYRQALSDQLEEVDRLSRLTDQLLFLCREDAGNRSEASESMRLDLVLEELCETFQATAGDRSITLACDETSPVVLAAPPDRVRRLFLNLIDNALRYAPPGGRVDVRMAEGQGSCRVTVEDDGTGIDPKDLPHLFERFYRGDASRSRATGGSGLGLAICRSIVESLGGEIRIENRPVRGTVATATLPTRRPIETAPSPRRDPAPAIRRSDSGYASTSSSAETLTTSAVRT